MSERTAQQYSIVVKLTRISDGKTITKRFPSKGFPDMPYEPLNVWLDKTDDNGIANSEKYETELDVNIVKVFPWGGDLFRPNRSP